MLFTPILADEKGLKMSKEYSATGNRTPVSRVTGGDTHHYTIVELINVKPFKHLFLLVVCLMFLLRFFD